MTRIFLNCDEVIMGRKNDFNDDLTNYGLELDAMVNNFKNNKRGLHEHIISESDMEKAYETYMPFLRSRLLSENDLFDSLGDEDLKNYEKWLE